MDTKYIIEEQTLINIANSIRTREGSDDSILVEEYADRIKALDLDTLEYLLLDQIIQTEDRRINNIIIDNDVIEQVNKFLTIYKNEREGY